MRTSASGTHATTPRQALATILAEASPGNLSPQLIELARQALAMPVPMTLTRAVVGQDYAGTLVLIGADGIDQETLESACGAFLAVIDGEVRP